MLGQIVPKDIPLYVGDTLYLSCHSFTNVAWFKNHKPLQYSVDAGRRTLTINEVKIKHSGTYECQGKDENNFPIRAYSEVYVGGKCTN